MQIIITQAEIEAAIKNHVLGMIAVNPSQQIDIDLKATRGDAGYQAIITITSQEQIELASSNVTRVLGGVLGGKAPRVSNPAPVKVPSTPAEVRAMLAEEAEAEETQEEEAQQEEAEQAEELVEEATEEVAEEAPQQAPAPIAVKRGPGRPPNALRLAAAQQSAPAQPEPVAEQVGGAPDAPAPKRLFGGFTKPKN